MLTNQRIVPQPVTRPLAMASCWPKREMETLLTPEK